MSDADYWKKMMLQGDTTDYSGGDFVNPHQAASVTRKSTGSVTKNWSKTKDHVNSDWLGASPGKARKSYVIKEKSIKPPDVNDSDDEPKKEEVKEEPVVVQHQSSSAPKAETTEEKTPEPVDSEVAKFRAMMNRDEGNDYATNEFLGEQASAYSSTSSPKKKWTPVKEHVNSDWLGASPGKARKSYVIKEKSIKPPDVDYSDDEKETPTPAPTPAPTPSRVEKKEEEVDPEVAKFRAMMNRDEGNDYATNEFLGEQASAYSSTSSPKKKWTPVKEHVNNDWLGASPGKARKSYVIKEKSIKPPDVDYSDDEKEETPKKEEAPTPAPAPVEKKEEEVDPEVAKFRAMMNRDEGNDYATNEFLGDQAAAYSSTSSTKKKWGTPVERSNDDWIGGGGSTRKSYVVKGSATPKSPAASRASFSHFSPGAMSSPKPVTSPKPSYGSSYASPGVNKTRASFSHFSPQPDISSGPPDARSSLTSPVSDKERMAGRASFSNAFAKFKSQDTALPSAFATALHPPTATTKKNFTISKAAKEHDREAHRSPVPHHSPVPAPALHHHDELHHEPTIKEEPAAADDDLHDDHKKELEEALQMLQKVFIRLDDREPSWKQMDATMKKIRKATQKGADIKSILSYSISSLQHIAGLLYYEDQTDTDDVVEKLIDLNMQL